MVLGEGGGDQRECTNKTMQRNLGATLPVFSTAITASIEMQQNLFITFHLTRQAW